jgi:hypothetical protein
VVQKVDSKDAVLLAFTDARFDSNADFNLQLGHVIVLWSGRTHVAVVLEAKSIKSRRVKRSVLGAELCGVTHGFDRGFMIRHQMTGLLGCTIPLVLLTDTLQIFHAITRLSAFSENILDIDAVVLRVVYEAGELHTISRVADGYNLADCSTIYVISCFDSCVAHRHPARATLQGNPRRGRSRGSHLRSPLATAL